MQMASIVQFNCMMETTEEGSKDGSSVLPVRKGARCRHGACDALHLCVWARRCNQ